MENLRKINMSDLSEYKLLIERIRETIDEASVILPLSVTNTLDTFEEKVDKEIDRRFS